MVDFPYMLYKHPGPHEIHGSKFDTNIVTDDAELEAALADSWHTSTYYALKDAKAVIPKTICVPDLVEDAPASVGKPVRWKS